MARHGTEQDRLCPAQYRSLSNALGFLHEPIYSAETYHSNFADAEQENPL